MEVRYTTDAQHFKRMTTEEVRAMFLIDTLFQPDTIPLVYADVDRSITGSAVPVTQSLELLAITKEMAAEYFTQRREIGVINIGEQGSIIVEGTEYAMAHKDALYIGKGSKKIVFKSTDMATPAKFYFVSYPAHKEYPATHAKFSDAEPTNFGSVKDANQRTIYKYIHPKGIPSCQLVMGLTMLNEGSVWNTMPVHTHQRRSEIYMYFGLPENALVFHLLGEPSETRHIVVKNQQAVLSTSWSIHSGVATQAYTFIWAMGGENQVFDDMDWVPMEILR
ncbi:MAG: 5-dehydro-4-deoxy-D-glucuronate isomerase [bacterium]